MCPPNFCSLGGHGTELETEKALMQCNAVHQELNPQWVVSPVFAADVKCEAERAGLMAVSTTWGTPSTGMKGAAGRDALCVCNAQSCPKLLRGAGAKQWNMLWDFSSFLHVHSMEQGYFWVIKLPKAVRWDVNHMHFLTKCWNVCAHIISRKKYRKD